MKLSINKLINKLLIETKMDLIFML